MEWINKGCTRNVLLIGDYAIKIVKSPFKIHHHFLVGCLANWRERDVYKIWKQIDYKNLEYIVPSYFCSWFGLIQIQKRVEEYQQDLTEEESKFFIENGICSDIKRENFGLLNNKLICLYYGQ